jgi:hypothetical protein
VTEGLTAEQQIQLQIETERRFSSTCRFRRSTSTSPVPAADIAEVESADRAISPQRIGVVQADLPADQLRAGKRR